MGASGPGRPTGRTRWGGGGRGHPPCGAYGVYTGVGVSSPPPPSRDQNGPDPTRPNQRLHTGGWGWKLAASWKDAPKTPQIIPPGRSAEPAKKPPNPLKNRL
eukprot:gene18390-biopygen8399